MTALLVNIDHPAALFLIGFTIGLIVAMALFAAEEFLNAEAELGDDALALFTDPEQADFDAWEQEARL
jgi:hypothetical protein